MIQFLRKIRQKLLVENKLNKYLIYAIGEIVLVVIGILIALQINNWNERKKLKNHERELLTHVLEDIAQDSLTIVNVMDLRDKIMEVHQSVFDYTKNLKDSSQVGDLDLLRRTFHDKLITKENNPNLSKEVMNQDLSKQIQEYYNAINLAEFVMNNNNTIIENKVRPFLGEKQLLIYGNQLEDLEINQLHLIDRYRFFLEIRNEQMQQLLFESGIKLYALRNWGITASKENDKLKKSINDYLSSND
ncbi:DUF6090 family protein [Winogradskyella sp. HB-48]|uniref:DUF6090 family protein n=1 Tax=Winogradskyella sp. HB-48 TaxID=3416808 RepID=UPI003CEFE6FD